MHPDWINANTAAEFDYVSADGDHRSYRAHHAPKAKRRSDRPKSTKPSGIYRRRNNRWGW